MKSSGEWLFSILAIGATVVYSLVLLWLTFTYRDQPNLLRDDG